MSNALRFRAAPKASQPETVIEWYRKREAQRRWRNLMRYGSHTRRGQALVELMLHTLRRLGAWMGGRHHG